MAKDGHDGGCDGLTRATSTRSVCRSCPTKKSWLPRSTKPTQYPRWSVSDQRGALSENPLLNRWAPPLVSGVVDEALGYGVSQHDQPLQHHRQVHISDRPGAEKVVSATVE